MAEGERRAGGARREGHLLGCRFRGYASANVERRIPRSQSRRTPLHLASEGSKSPVVAGEGHRLFGLWKNPPELRKTCEILRGGKRVLRRRAQGIRLAQGGFAQLLFLLFSEPHHIAHAVRVASPTNEKFRDNLRAGPTAGPDGPARHASAADGYRSNRRALDGDCLPRLEF